ncbi:MAG: M1 family metallopeptidase [Planctomycetota bacterium]
MKSRILSLALCLIASGAASGQDEVDPRAATLSGGPLIPEQAAYDVLSYELSVTVDPERQWLDGELTVEARVLSPMDWLVLDLDPRMKVSKITFGEDEAKWERREDRIWIALGETQPKDSTLRATVIYAGEPRVAPNPPWSGGFTWSKTEAGAPWIAVSCQLDGADLWWPCKDHPGDEPETMKLQVTIPEPLVCASNGRLVEVSDALEDGWHTYRWQIDNPINNYCVSLNIAPYEVIEADYRSIAGETMPVIFWVLPEAKAKAQKLMPQILKELRFFEETVGPYPFRSEKYGIAHTPYLGMEHQTIISYGADFELNSSGFDWLHLHELAHEWWGNLVTNADYKDFWIHEGLGTYMEVLAAEYFKGPEAGRGYTARLRFSINNRAPIARREPTAIRNVYFVPPKYIASDNDVYYKAALVMHTLRYLIGDEAFRKTIRKMTYPTKALEKATDGSQCRFVTTAEFQDLAEEISGQDLGWFFELYLYQPDLPELIEVRTQGGVTLTWKTPEGLPFPMPVEVQVGKQTRRFEPDEQGHMRVPLKSGSELTVDPGGWILREMPRPRRERGGRR